jgi:hypothetical protein
MSLFSRSPRAKAEPAPVAAGPAPDSCEVAPAGAPELPPGWAYVFAAPSMGHASIAIRDVRGNAVATERFVGHAQSPEFVLATACTRAFGRWQASGAIVTSAEVRPFTISAGPEGDGWRVWCNQALGVTLVVDDLAHAEELMAGALAEQLDLERSALRVTLVPST